MRVILFDGQGSTPSSSTNSTQPSRTPLAALFVCQAHAALATRIKALSPTTRDALGPRATRVLLDQLCDGSIMLPTVDATLLRHPLVALPSLYIAQVVRLLEEVETHGLADSSLTELIGYSSGLLPALLVATSFPSSGSGTRLVSAHSQIMILANALALFDVALSVGIETQAARDAMYDAGGISLDDPARDNEWSAVVFGEPRETLEDKLNAWNVQKEDSHHWAHLTAQTTATCHTISGLPSVLRDFLGSNLLSTTSFSSFTTTNSSASSSSSVSCDDSDTTSNTLSRRSSASSFSSPATSLCPASSKGPAGLEAPNHSLPLFNHLTSISTCTSPSLRSSTSTIKPLGIYTLFHADVPHLRAVRDRVLALYFPSSHYDNTAIARPDSPNTPTYLNLPRNEPDFTHTDRIEEGTRVVLSDLRLADGYNLYDMRTGCAMPADLAGKGLITRVLDLILLERTEFAVLMENLAEKANRESKVELVNFGPGTSLARIAMRKLKERVPNAVTLSDLSSTSITTNPAKEIPTSANRGGQEPIAIVGMAVNFPGARDTSELWRVLEQGINTVEEIPQTRFSIAPYTDTNPNSNPGRKLKTRFGNFLSDGLHSSFDNAFFRISPREARALDPQMRVLMRVGLQAAEAAGLVVEESAEVRRELGEGVIRSEDVGCFVGVATNDYVHNLRNDVGVHYATGTLPSFLAGRLAYALHLSGPSVVLDTACSSSLVAIHQACRALVAGDCKAALAGGVNVISSPDMYLGLDRAHFLSPTGNCKPWDASADGYCRSEGSGMFVLKRLSDALASSDNILGVIRGTEINQSAAAVSITRPHAPTQAALFRKLLEKSGVRPEEVSLVEAHGTGTQAGDPEELKSIRDVLSPNSGSGRSENNTLTVTSIKANIGHAEAASGAASLAKVLLMLRHRAVPSQVGLVTLNPKIESLEKDFTHINNTGACVEWSADATGPRIALVNNFGAAGNNAAMLVEEAPLRASTTGSASSQKDISDHVLVTLSAETEEALLRLRDTYISSATDSSLVDFGYTATARRKARPWRLAATGNSVAGLSKALNEAVPTRFTRIAGAGNKKIIFVFSGQGGQHLGMGRQLYNVSSFFRAAVVSCHEKLVSWGYPGVLAIIDTEDKSGLEKDDELVAFQCAIFVLECALCSLWGSWGVKPDAVVGHSLGEYASLVAAGVVSLDAGLHLVAHRARLMTQRCSHGTSGMMVVRLPADAVTEAIAKLDGCAALSISCHNGPTDNVIGGPHEQLALLKSHLELSGSKCITVNVPFAYHTAAMEPILDDLTVFARKFDFKSPLIPIVSNVTGKVVQPGDATVFRSEYFAKHCRQAVQFEEGTLDLISELGMIGAFIEIGPHPTTLPMFSHLMPTTGAVALPSLHKKMTTRTTLCSALSRLFVLRDDINWGKAYRGLFPDAACVEIPGYPLVETEFWVPYIEETSSVMISEPVNPLKRFSFLGSWTQKPLSKDGNTSEFETPIELIAEYITGHKVASSPLCPASVYYELALSAATCTLEHTDDLFSDSLTLSEVQFTLPLVFEPTKPVTIRTSINLHPHGGKHAGTFSISSVLGGREESVHCTGFFQRRQKNAMALKLQMHCGTVERGKAALLSPDSGVHRETLRTRTIYELIFSRVVQYSKLYQVINTLTLDERNGEGFATFRLSADQASKSFVAQPVFVDALLHAAGFLINSRAAGSEAFICNQVDSSKILFDIDHSATFEVYCTTTSAGEGIMLADAWAIQTGESRKVVAHMKRMRFSRVRLSSLSRLLSRTDDIPSRNGSPTPSFRPSSERCTSVTPLSKLGSPFRPTHRAHTPSAMSISTFAAFDVSVEVMRLVAEVCDVPLTDITPESNLADLGVDSLIWIELVGQLKSAVSGVSIEVSEIMLSTTVGDLINKFSRADQRPMFDAKSFGTHSPFSKLAPNSTMPTEVQVDSPLEDTASIPLQVKHILGSVLDIPSQDLSDTDSLDTLGLDSLGSIEAMAELQDKFQITLPHDFFIECPTVGTVQIAISNILNQRSLSRQSSAATLINAEPFQKVIEVVGLDRTLLPLQSSQNGASPLFLVHDGSGLSHCYSRVGNLDRALYGISNPKLLTGESWRGGVVEMAAHYVDQIKPMVTNYGCVLGGWSFGGVVAFHMACELMRAGVKVAGVVLIDSPSPFTQKPLPEALIESVIRATSSSDSSKQQAQVVKLARAQMSHATQALVAYDPFGSLSISEAPAMPNVVMLRCTDTFPLSELRHTIPLEPMPFLEDRSDQRTFVQDWERLVGKEVPVLDIPGHHFEPFAPKNANALTEQLKKALAYLHTAA